MHAITYESGRSWDIRTGACIAWKNGIYYIRYSCSVVRDIGDADVGVAEKIRDVVSTDTTRLSLQKRGGLLLKRRP
jgi:hypothetical protein